MRLIGVTTTVVTLVLAFVRSGLDEAPTAEQRSGRDEHNGERRHEVPRRRISTCGLAKCWRPRRRFRSLSRRLVTDVHLSHQ
jgi:hypothetical protein